MNREGGLKRITNDYLLVSAHQFFPKEKAREIALHASRIIKKAYQTKPVFFSSRRKDSVISGLFYLLSYYYDSPKTIMYIAQEFEIGARTVSDSYRRWLKEFPEMFPEFELKTKLVRN